MIDDSWLAIYDSNRVCSESRKISYGEPLEAAETLCDILSRSVIGVVGPTSPVSAFHVRNFCDLKDIPLVEIFNDGSSKHVINMHPTPIDMGKAFMFLIEQYNWKGFTILFKDAPWYDDFMIASHRFLLAQIQP